ncbi:MAG TPA: Gfo/Idh/MocA family oxidoreductase, partial [Chthonomonadaceae bacterium]|nr:Gfo/Idh/MocA family oxidoreductase [Chthonomonadaceae bacterium]
LQASQPTRRKILTGAAAMAIPEFVPRTVFGVGAPSNRLNIAVIGLGTQGRRLLAAFLSTNAHVLALCDVDRRQIAKAKAETGLKSAAEYTDYRELLRHEPDLQAVVIATPDHWHMHLCHAAMEARKHVYCEKPLAHSVAEARYLRWMARATRVVTQMGNQGSASDAFRRCVDAIGASLLGQVREVHAYVPGGRFPRGIDRPEGGSGPPRGLDWDFWCGPAPEQPYHDHIYHPFDWRGWYSFGSGQLGDFGCHAFNLPARALQLGYPDRIEVSGTGFGKPSYFVSGQVRMHFPARGSLAPVTLNWYDDMNPPTTVFRDVIRFYGEAPSGVLLVGDGGLMFTSPHNKDGVLKLKGEKTFTPVLHHEAVRKIPSGLPRVRSHYDEWVRACRGHGMTYSPFEIGGHLTEIVQAGVLALRLGESIDWDGVNMRVPDMPAADRLIRLTYRPRYTHAAA